MRKAKTPPKRKPVPAGRRAAKPKTAKGKRAKVAKAGTSAKPKAKATGSAAVKPVKGAAAAGQPGKTPAVARAPKVAAPAVAKASAPDGKNSKIGDKGAPRKVAATSPRSGHDGAKDSKKHGHGERSAEKSGLAGAPGGRAESTSSGATVAEKAMEAVAPAGLPTPIASFTI